MVTLQDMADALDLKPKKDRKGFAAYGEIKSINPDNTYQVSLNGSDTTVKCARLTGAHVGDVVLVNVLDNGYAVVTGCVGGDTDALEALEQSGATVQHFWYDNTGAHVTEDTQEDYQQDPSSAGGNTLITSQGMAIRKGTTELASFGASNAKIGTDSNYHMIVAPSEISMYRNATTKPFSITFPTTFGGHDCIMQSEDAPAKAMLELYTWANSQGTDTSESVTIRATDGTKAGYILINKKRVSIVAYDWEVAVFEYDTDESTRRTTLRGGVRGDLETPTVSISATTGTLVSASARRFGQMVQLYMQVRKTSSTAAGANVFVGTLNTTGLRPVLPARGASYFGAHSIVGALSATGGIIIRNASSTAVTIGADETAGITFTYLVA